MYTITKLVYMSLFFDIKILLYQKIVENDKVILFGMASSKMDFEIH